MNRIYAFAAAVFLLAAAAARAQPAGGDREVVKVNGTPIRQSEVMERLWKRFGPQTLDEMVDELLMRQNMQAQSIKPEPAEVDRRLSRIRAQFADQATFEAQLKQNGSSVEALKKDISEQLAQETIIARKNNLKVSDEEVKRAFTARKDQLGTPPSVHLQHMMVADQKKADEIVAKLKGGADFKALAKAESLAPTGKVNGGDYGFVSRGALPPELDGIAFAMKPKEIKSVAGGRGVHILRAVEFKPGAPADYAKVKDDLRQLLLAEKIKAALPAYLRELRQKADIQPQGS